VDIDPSDRESNYNFASLIRQTILILTGFSTTPLRLTSWLGFVMTLFGMGVFVYVLTIYFTQGSLPGFPFLASLVALLNGTELLAMGIFGEYLARVFERSVDRPTYVVREQIGGEAR
jgi:undecaprenyl-phosphate 4-deoxy-4-formamido-L-arabinose transferase